MPLRLLDHKDNAAGQLNSSISAVTTTIILKSGEGANFPAPFKGAATSGGSAIALNSTGIGASGIAAGDFIENVTDGSFAVVLTVNTNDIVTTPLKGGSGNTWDNSDEWRVNAFVGTLIQYDTDGTTILKREKVLVEARSTDTLTVERGHDGSSAQSFDADDYFYQFVVAESLNNVTDVLSEMIQYTKANADDIATRITVDSSEIYGADSVGTDAYAVTLNPAPTSLTAGMVVNVKIGTTNVGPCTLNVNGLGAVSIKRADGNDPDNGDLIAGQIASFIYDGTNWQLRSPIANLPPTEFSTTEKIMTLSKDTLGGKVVSINSSGEIESCAPTSLTAKGSTTATGGGAAGSDVGHRRMFRLSPTKILAAYLTDMGGNDDILLTVFTVDPTDGSITSQDSSLSVNMTTNIQPQGWDIDVIDESTAIVVVNDAGTLKGFIASSLDGTPAIGSAQSLGSGVSSSGIGVKVRDASNAFIIKQTASTGLQTIALSISGSTITAGTTDTFVSDASNVLYVGTIERYVGTDFYCVWYKNNTAGTYHAVACEYDDATHQFDNVGTPITLDAVYAAIGAELRQVTDTCVVACSRRSGTGSYVYLRTITRSGTTLTENAATQLAHDATLNNTYPTLEMLSSHHGIAVYDAGATGIGRLQLFEVSQGTEDTVTLIDTYLDLGSGNTHASACLLTRNTLLVQYYQPTNFVGAPVTFEDNLDLHIGVLQADALDGGTEKVTFNGYEDGFSGLVAGTKYQVAYSGDVTDETTANGWPEIMKAVTTTAGIVRD